MFSKCYLWVILIFFFHIRCIYLYIYIKLTGINSIMAVLQNNKNDKNLSNHILLLKRVDIKNILNLPLKATQRVKVSE